MNGLPASLFDCCVHTHTSSLAYLDACRVPQAICLCCYIKIKGNRAGRNCRIVSNIFGVPAPVCVKINFFLVLAEDGFVKIFSHFFRCNFIFCWSILKDFFFPRWLRTLLLKTIFEIISSIMWIASSERWLIIVFKSFLLCRSMPTVFFIFTSWLFFMMKL